MKTISTKIEIGASPERVWGILADFDKYREWNPFMTDIAGYPQPGEKIEVALQPPGRHQVAFHPRVESFVPGRELRWKGRLGFGGLLNGEHIMSIKHEAGGVSFVQEERLSGILLPLVGKDFLQRTRLGLEFMNEALKKRAEKFD